MLDILLITAVVLAACVIIIIYRAGIRQRLFNELSSIYNEAVALVKSCGRDKIPAELRKYLHEPLQELAVSLRAMEEGFNNQAAIFRMKQIMREEKPKVEALCADIREICFRWNRYANYRQRLLEGISEANSRIYEINELINAIVRQDKSFADMLQVRAAGILSQLDEYQALCKELNTLTFADYSSDNKAPELSDAFLKDVDILKQELQYFSRPIKVLITGLFRKSIYYLVLEDSGEKATRRNAGTVQVSYKTFREAKKGDSYKWDIVIGGKYTAGEQNITFKIFKGDTQSSITQKLDRKQFEEIFKAIKFNRKFEETDENGVPYQINALDLNFPVCEKKAYDFDVSYDLDIFKGMSIYDFLTLSHSSLELAPAEETQNPEDSAEDQPSPEADTASEVTQ